MINFLSKVVTFLCSMKTKFFKRISKEKKKFLYNSPVEFKWTVLPFKIPKMSSFLFEFSLLPG